MSDESSMVVKDEDKIQALQDFVINNPHLDELEDLVDQFNIFEALGAVRVELRHSDFLAFLLDPNQNHGLGSIFLRRVLEYVLLSSQHGLDIQPIDIELWDLDSLEVRREWHNIDIFLLDQDHQFAVVIENKIRTGASSAQLDGYLKTVHQRYPGYRILPIFLSPDVTRQDEEEPYAFLNYDAICNILERILETRKTVLSDEVATVIQHYAAMIRRHIMSDSKIEELCRSIYSKHKRALDLIYEYRPDLQAIIHDHLAEVISGTKNIKILRDIKSEISFIPSEWDVDQFYRGNFSQVSNSLMYFFFLNHSNSLRFGLVIAPGTVEIRQQLLEMALKNQPPFKSAYRQLNQMWNNIYTSKILTSNDFEDPDVEKLTTKIDSAWKRFIDNELPQMVKVVQNQKWLWED